MPLLRKVQVRDEVIVIVCDAELIGREFKQGELKLEVKGSFYGGKEASVGECLDAIREATIANLVGSIVEHAIQAGIIERENVIRIQDVPHAQLVRLKF